MVEGAAQTNAPLLATAYRGDSKAETEVAMSLPDLVQDNCTDAAFRLGCKFMESFFFRAALEAGYGQRSEDKARELHTLWVKQGYQVLPSFVKNFALKVCSGEATEHKEVY